ncbi:hypothetical protein GCM10023156_16290 [Novipirellula rosea]|uniref:Uncharacterized protein n=1 Tax=Novipirellula rosea TaxID=1031540 RepID=A0ABP8MIT9_9BACT
MIGEPQIRKRTVRDLAVRDLGICKGRFNKGQGGDVVRVALFPPRSSTIDLNTLDLCERELRL